MNLRDQQREDLKIIRNDWWISVSLVAPGGTVYNTAAGTSDQLLGDVRKESEKFDPDIGMDVMVKKLSITIRIDDLTRVPLEGENWFVSFSDDLTDSGTVVKYAFTPNNVDVGGDSMGYIKIFPQDAVEI